MVVLGIAFIISVFVSSCCLFLASRLIAYDGRLIDFSYIVIGGATASLVPVIGWLLSPIVIIFLLIRLLDSSIIDAIWVALTAGMLQALLLLGLA